MIKEIIEISDSIGLTLIELVGISTILVGAGLVIWLFMYKKLKEFKNMIVEMKDDTPRNITNQALSIEPINDNLKKLIDKYNSDRAGILLIHNGVHSENRLDLLKFSITDEALSGRHKSILSKFQDIPLSLYGSWVSDIFSKKRIAVKDIKEIENTMNGVYMSLKYNNVKSIYMFPLYPVGSDCPDGVGFLEFCEENVELTEEEKDIICSSFGVIYGMKEKAKYNP